MLSLNRLTFFPDEVDVDELCSDLIDPSSESSSDPFSSAASVPSAALVQKRAVDHPLIIDNEVWPYQGPSSSWSS